MNLSSTILYFVVIKYMKVCKTDTTVSNKNRYFKHDSFSVYTKYIILKGL